ncbi:MAG: heavy-metal-associated domain-containing protein [Armatimonadota bacterium]|nr:heavy-metal-associated domain-containing protein [Armatimonadota bacterium]
METTFTAPDIECAGCAASIEKALGRAPGVLGVRVGVPEKTVTVRFDEAQTNAATLAETLTEVGFPPQG